MNIKKIISYLVPVIPFIIYYEIPISTSSYFSASQGYSS